MHHRNSTKQFLPHCEFDTVNGQYFPLGQYLMDLNDNKRKLVACITWSFFFLQYFFINLWLKSKHVKYGSENKVYFHWYQIELLNLFAQTDIERFEWISSQRVWWFYLLTSMSFNSSERFTEQGIFWLSNRLKLFLASIILRTENIQQNYALCKTPVDNKMWHMFSNRIQEMR